MSRPIPALPVGSSKPKLEFFCEDHILRIFGSLHDPDIARMEFPVCKTWHEIDRDPMGCKTLYIDISTINLCSRIEGEIVQVVQKTILLETLYLSARDDVSYILESVARLCPCLTTLRLECLIKSPRSVQALVSGCPLIGDLEIASASGAALNEFAELKRLQSFVVSQSDGWFDDTFLSRLSTNNLRLAHLSLDKSAYYNDQNLIPLFDNLQQSLNSVTMDGSFCTRHTYQQLARCERLAYLNIMNAFNIKDTDLKEFEYLSNVTSLGISDVKKIRSNAICSFITNFKSNKLSFVRFDGWPSVDHLLENFVRSYDDTILYKVESIDLSGCENLTERLVELILKGNSVLGHLRLSSIPFLRGTAFNTTDTTVAPLLKKLDVSNCIRMVVSYLHTFRNNRHHLTIVYPSESDGHGP